jgi:O-antigen ligase
VIVWILFAALNGATYFWSVSATRTADGFVILLSLVGLYVLLTLMPIDERDVSRLRVGTILGGVAICVWGAYLLATGNLPEEKAGLPRFSIAGGVGDAADPNITAAVLILPFALALGVAVFGRRLSVRTAGAAGAAITAGGILLTASRGGMLAAVVAAGVLVGHHRRRVQVFAAVALVAAGVVVLAFAAAPEQVARLDTSGSSGRTNLWRAAILACPQYCAFGSGLDTFPRVQERVLLGTPELPGFRLGEPAHNIWLGAIVETGITSVVLMAVGLGLAALHLLRLPSHLRAPPLGGLAGLMVSNTFLGNLRFKYFWLVLMYAAATTLAHGARRGDEPGRVADATTPTRAGLPVGARP